MSEAEPPNHGGGETIEPSFEHTLMCAFHDLWKRRLWVFLCLVVLAGGVLVNGFSQIPYYRATVEILVNPRSIQNSGERETLKNLSLQEVLITSPKIADAVIEKMHLKDLPFFGSAEDVTMSFLSLLSVKPDSKSGTLEIFYDFPDPQNAAAIANEIAEMYVHSSLSRSEGATQGSLEALTQQLQNEQAKQTETRAKIAELTAQYPELTETGELQSQVKFFNGELLKTENRIMEVRNTLDELEGYQKRGEPLDLHPYVRNHPNVSRKLERIRELELLLVELKQEYREMHPEVTKANAKLTALRDVLQDEEEKILAELRRELNSREKDRDEVKRKTQEIQRRLQGTTPEKTKYGNYLTELASRDEAIRMLNKRMSDFVMEGSLKQSSSDLEIMRYATPPKEPFKPNIKKNLFMAMVFGFFTILGLFYSKNYFNRTIRRSEDVYRLLRRPLVGQTIHLKKNKGFLEPEFADAEAGTPFSSMVGLISANSDFLVGKEKNYSILVTSSLAGEGKTFLAYQLALTSAAKGKKTVLVDADFCRARLTRQFDQAGVKPPKFLDDYLVGNADEKDLIVPTQYPLLDFIGAGTGKSSSPHSFRSLRIRDLIAKLQASYDIVLFDTPPVIPANDAVALSPFVNLRLFVINAGRTSQKDIRRALLKIDSSHQALIGVILNQMNHIDRGYEYYQRPKKK